MDKFFVGNEVLLTSNASVQYELLKVFKPIQNLTSKIEEESPRMINSEDEQSTKQWKLSFNSLSSIGDGLRQLASYSSFSLQTDGTLN